ncbi:MULTISPECIES: SDR family oxidoreductase [Asaia]|uniref:Oxidoreductase n=1 Tax=Asaia bogorensis TaxID=91915 RepID=A0A060QF10_9PROT|nr:MULTISPECIES: SDR family oxidoreductase [Asaia]ETC99672.1 oxidoreductase [Asaia sp. SF2.1]MDL2169745.1 SDR family oxidoreductase [Asaia sp. HumB]CDG39674.1 oxidoreductase [Asaia bogorensis]
MSASGTRKILIIGGSRGIGRAIVERFAAEGDDISFTWSGSQAAAEAVAANTGARAIRSDVSDRDGTITLMRDVGQLDVLVYNSAILLPGDPLTLDPDSVDHLIDVNIRGPYFASVEAARQMKKGGRIILIGSVHGDRMPFEGITAYGMSKSALQGLARGLARDLGARDITVNVVQPGPTNTDMNPHDGPLVQAMHDEMALKRHGTAEDVAHLVAYLAGPHASGITGAMHTIDGGFGA